MSSECLFISFSQKSLEISRIVFISELRSKILPLEKNSNKICFFARLFVSLQPNSNSIVMTTIELRSSILADLDEMSVEMLQNVSHYVKRLRRHARPVKQTVTDEAIPDVVLSLLGAGDPIADEDLNAREAYNQYLEEKYK